MADRLHLCRPGWSETLAAELGRALPRSTRHVVSSALVTTQFVPEGDAEAVSLAFARQTLPGPEPVEAASISKWSAAVCERVIANLRDSARPWRLHVIHVPKAEGEAAPRRCRLIRDAVLADLKDRRRKIWKAVTADETSDWQPEEALVQVLLNTATSGWISVCHPEERDRLRRCLSRFAGGAVDVVDDKAAPSSAHKKLREVEIRLARPIAAGETCVDLGGSPGGWSWVALSRGATVHAVDRSPLRADLMSNPRLTFTKGDAFSFEPPQPVDWLLCDVIAFPQRTLELLDQWLTAGWCRWFCVTIKFRGRQDDVILEHVKEMLKRHGAEFTLRQLDANRNEVTAFGTAR